MGTFTVTGSGFGWSWGSDRSRHVGHRLALTVTRVPHKAHAQKNVDPKVPSPGRRVSYWGYPHEPIRGSAPFAPDDVTAPSSPSLLLRANVLIFWAIVACDELRRDHALQLVLRRDPDQRRNGGAHLLFAFLGA